MSVAGMAVEVSNSRAIPNLSAARPSLTANANPLDTPPATGGIAVAQSPSGAIITNTNRSISATSSWFATLPYRLFRPPLVPYIQP